MKTYFRNQTHVGVALHSIRRMLAPKVDLPEESQFILEEIRRNFSDKEIIFLHLPSKDEVKRNVYDSDVETLIKEVGLKYWPALYRCSISTDGFFELDGHPNQKGYDQITQCAYEMLENIL